VREVIPVHCRQITVAHRCWTSSRFAAFPTSC
jgi:hypothetical protein